MALEVDGKTIETTENGHLVNGEDWTEAVAEAIAETDKLEMTQQHWDVVKYLRDEHY
ncbi:MAG: TusE/DsrC/DsvC family sulfur relay protein, partial [Thiogranum sp.]